MDREVGVRVLIPAHVVLAPRVWPSVLWRLQALRGCAFRWAPSVLSTGAQTKSITMKSTQALLNFLGTPGIGQDDNRDRLKDRSVFVAKVCAES